MTTYTATVHSLFNAHGGYVILPARTYRVHAFDHHSVLNAYRRDLGAFAQFIDVSVTTIDWNEVSR